MKKIVILTGAGISAESGIKTFRDADGLWERHDVMEVATPEGFAKNPTLVLEFYNQRRKQLHQIKPNDAHFALKDLDNHFETTIITQNVDDLHERAGSKNIVHLHGELFKVRSTKNELEVLDWKKDLNIGDKCSNGHQLRPHIVWFGEAVPNINLAFEICEQADIIIIIGTSLQVYPAAGLHQAAKNNCQIYYLDANPALVHDSNIRVIANKASIAIPELVKKLIANEN